jgi:hypothetical protein
MEKKGTIKISKESKHLALKVIVVPPTILKDDFRILVSWKRIKIVKLFSLDSYFLETNRRGFSPADFAKYPFPAHRQ